MAEVINIKIGDKVKIVDTGRAYTTYAQLLFNKSYVFEKEDLSYYTYGADPEGIDLDETVWEVVYMAKHEDFGDMITYIVNRTLKKGFMVGIDGLEKIVETEEERLDNDKEGGLKREDVIDYLDSLTEEEVIELLEESNKDVTSLVTDEEKEEIVADWWRNASYSEVADYCDSLSSSGDVAIKIIEKMY